MEVRRARHRLAERRAARRHAHGRNAPDPAGSRLLTSPRLFERQLPALWRLGPVTIADQTRDDTVVGIAGRILADAPPRFALAGLSMGGYVAFEVLRQAPERVARLALLDTSARPDTPEQTQRRLGQIELARGGRFGEIADQQFPLLVHRSRHGDAAARELVRLMADETGPEAFIRQQQAIMGRPRLAAGARRHRLPDAGAGRRRRPADPAGVVGGDGRRHPGRAAGRGGRRRSPEHPRPARAGHRGAGGLGLGRGLTPPGTVAGVQLPGR